MKKGDSLHAWLLIGFYRFIMYKIVYLFKRIFKIKCKYCGVVNVYPDKNCYANPNIK